MKITQNDYEKAIKDLFNGTITDEEFRNIIGRTLVVCPRCSNHEHENEMEESRLDGKKVCKECRGNE